MDDEEEWRVDEEGIAPHLRFNPEFWREVEHGTSAAPGSELKLNIFTGRYARGFPMHHPNDRKPTSGEDRHAEKSYDPYFWTDGTPPTEFPEASEEDSVD